jgi:hypothetical protein
MTISAGGRGAAIEALTPQRVSLEQAFLELTAGSHSKLGLPPSDADHRRVLAVLAYLES